MTVASGASTLERSTRGALGKEGKSPGLLGPAAITERVVMAFCFSPLSSLENAAWNDDNDGKGSGARQGLS